MSAYNVSFLGDVRKISVFDRRQKRLIWSFVNFIQLQVTCRYMPQRLIFKWHASCIYTPMKNYVKYQMISYGELIQFQGLQLSNWVASFLKRGLL